MFHLGNNPWVLQKDTDQQAHEEERLRSVITKLDHIGVVIGDIPKLGSDHTSSSNSRVTNGLDRDHPLYRDYSKASMGQAGTNVREERLRSYVSDNLHRLDLGNDNRGLGIRRKIDLCTASNDNGHTKNNKDEYEIKGLSKMEPGYDFKLEWLRTAGRLDKI